MFLKLFNNNDLNGLSFMERRVVFNEKGGEKTPDSAIDKARRIGYFGEQFDINDIIDIVPKLLDYVKQPNIQHNLSPKVKAQIRGLHYLWEDIKGKSGVISQYSNELSKRLKSIANSIDLDNVQNTMTIGIDKAQQEADKKAYATFNKSHPNAPVLPTDTIHADNANNAGQSLAKHDPTVLTNDSGSQVMFVNADTITATPNGKTAKNDKSKSNNKS